MLPWDKLLISRCTWKIFVPWLCPYLSSSSSHICLVVEQKRTLVAMSFLIEWSSQEMTIALHHSHCATKGPVAGLMHEPVTNLSLCLDTKETSQDLFHWPKFWPIRGSEDKVQFGWLEVCRNSSWDGSSAIVLESMMDESRNLDYKGENSWAKFLERAWAINWIKTIDRRRMKERFQNYQSYGQSINSGTHTFVNGGSDTMLSEVLNSWVYNHKRGGELWCLIFAL